MAALSLTAVKIQAFMHGLLIATENSDLHLPSHF